jgi:phage gpG-like protein
VSNAQAYSELRILQQKVRAMANGTASREIMQAIEQEAAVQLEAGFREQRSPYGVPWRPKKKPNGYGTLRSARNYLSRNFRFRATSRGLLIANSAVYANAHQYGYSPRNLPARPMVPYASRLGRIWEAAFDRAANRAMQKYLRVA